MVAKHYFSFLSRLIAIVLALFCFVSIVDAGTGVTMPPTGAVPGGTGGGGILTQPTGAVPGGTGTGVTTSPRPSSGGSAIDSRPLYDRIVEPNSGDVLTPSFATGSTPSIGGLVDFLFDLLVRRILPLIVGVMVIFIVWGGYQYIMAAGDSAKVKQARDTILYSVIAMLLALSALTIVTILNNILLETRP